MNHRLGIFHVLAGFPVIGPVGRVWKSRTRVLAEFWDEPAAIQAMRWDSGVAALLSVKIEWKIQEKPHSFGNCVGV